MKPYLYRQSAVSLARALAQRELTAATLARALLARSGANVGLQAWVHLDPRHVLRQARGLDRGVLRGVLHGLPVGVKDNIDTAGLPTAYGSPIYDAHVPAADAACVALSRAQGAWVMGKTACTEFANMTPCATYNPWSAGHTPGGSSSGSAAAVAAGLVPLALGTQTAGSVIRPAAFCGIVGYKPTARRIARAGTKANADTLDDVGVFARSVEDAALLAGALGAVVPKAAAGVKALRGAPHLGLTLTSRSPALAPAMSAMLQGAGARLSGAGARVHQVGWPAAFDALFDAQRTVQVYETARALAPEALYRAASLSAGLKALLAEGRGTDARAYAAALQVGREAVERLDTLFGAATVLLTPAAPGAAPATRLQTGDPLFNRPWQLLGCPCLTLPGGLDADGLPLGLQLVARPGADAELFAAAAWVYRELDAETITLACCSD